MSRSEIVALVASNPEYKQACKRVARNNPVYEDLFHDAIIVLCTYNDARLKEVYEGGYLRPFFVRIVLNMWHAGHRKITLPAPNKYSPAPNEYDYEIDTAINNVKSQLATLKSKNRRGYFQAETLSAYVREGSAGQLATKTGIAKRTIAYTVKKTKLELREMCSIAK